MDIAFSPTRPDTDSLAFAVAKGALASLPLAASATLVAGAAAARFTGETGTSFESFVEEDGKLLRVVLVGTGSGSDADMERAGGALAAKLLSSGATHVAVECIGDVTGEGAARLGFGALLRSWRIDTYRTKMPEKAKPTLETVTIVSTDAGAAWDRWAAVAAGVAFTRELVSEPANILYPESFVERCRHLADLGIKISVLDRAAMEELGMGSLLGVAQGSVREARLLAMEWDGTGGTAAKPVVFVGKGVTFDTGGISIKPADGMEDMKWDMGGAAAVTGTMIALAGRKAKVNAVGVLGLVENMPDGDAQRPGDVVVSMSGQTVEVINTDAEGRLVLADALWYTQQRFKPKFMIDLATLTGAMIVALGLDYAGVFSNSDAVADPILAASKKVGENFWRMPIPDIYEQHIDSKIADVKNTGNGRAGGSITAALFLQRFTNGVPWAHLDIAPTAWANKSPSPTVPEGGVGFAVRTLDRMVADAYEA